MSNFLLTGAPRSGTSLVCACLNSLPDCVALVEPMGMPKARERQAAAREIADFVAQMRADLLSAGKARSALVDGDATDNTFEAPKPDGDVRRLRARVGDWRVGKPLTSHFRLIVKHPGTFTALAEELSGLLPLYAIIRHPLPTLASWQTVDIPIRDGWWPPAEAFAPDLKDLLGKAGNATDRQVALIRWIFRVYRGLPPGHVITYESIVDNPGVALAALSGSHERITHPVENILIRQRYPHVDLSALGRALLRAEEDIEFYYPNFSASLAGYLA